MDGRGLQIAMRGEEKTGADEGEEGKEEEEEEEKEGCKGAAEWTKWRGGGRERMK